MFYRVFLVRVLDLAADVGYAVKRYFFLAIMNAHFRIFAASATPQDTRAQR